MPSPRTRPLWIAGSAAGAVLLTVAGFWMEARYEAQELERKAEAMTLGNVARGRAAFGRYSCGGCHAIMGVSGANGTVGPPLDGVAARGIIGGRLANNPDNLRAWIERPQSISPGTAMPDLGVTRQDSRDIAAFLYTRT
ncbi:MAG: c-type cytochrome [Alphaproteobacteria bacterium]|nr:c-type cytochrome [Alphaproteobacteria bacterium]MBV9371657.1 c-type cytochrome [Alphaproteobacteria bacterium]MBV9900853.1 c-type cytochrome [Alphaproteobacteria bacterium]